MSKHTPGPWNIRAERYRFIHVYAPLGGIAHMDTTDGEGAANARLIAAAPDMYEALKDLLSGWRYIREQHGDLYGVGWDRAEDKAKAALAKAEAK